jgi:hypothetical protein
VKRLFAVLAMVGVLAGCSGATATPPRTTPGSTTTAITAALAKVKVIPERPNVPGYDRSCKKGHGCSFGPAWKDVDRNGCDTRNDVLRAQLRDVAVKPGTRGCVVLSGTGTDPYTGAAINWRKSAGGVDIDHVYPLARAWDMGAAKWRQDKRVEFANDQATNLFVTKSATNRSKGDNGPGEWMPLKPANACVWVLRYLQSAAKWELPVTQADSDAAREIAPKCGGAR